MPFDIAGNFTRTQNFQQDRDNGIKILAARVDNEFDNFATGMNAVFFRDGRVPMQADLRMNINRITGIADGSVGSPALKFNTDASTGPYLDGLNRYAISVNGVQRTVFTTAGVDVTGTLSQGGVAVATQTWVSGAYAPKASPTFTGTVSGAQFNGTNFRTSGGGNGFITDPRDATTPSPVIYSPTTGQLNLYNGTSDIVTINGTQVTVSNKISVPQLAITGNAGAITVQPRDLTGASPVIYSATGGMINLNNGGGSDLLQLNANTATFIPGTMFLGTNKLLVQQDGTNGYLRTQAGGGTLNLGANGASSVTLNADGSTTIINDLIVTGDGIKTRRVGSPTQGVLYLGDQSAGGRYLYYDSTQYNLPNAPLAVGGAITAAGRVVGTSTGTSPATAGLTAKANASNLAAIDFVNNAFSVSYGYLQCNSSGNLYWSGAGGFTAQGNITSLSDERVKTAIRPLENARALVKSLEGVRYIKDGKPDLGLIAQRVQRTVPEVVLADDKGLLSLDYGRLVALLIQDNNQLAERLDRAGL